MKIYISIIILALSSLNAGAQKFSTQKSISDQLINNQIPGLSYALPKAIKKGSVSQKAKPTDMNSRLELISGNKGSKLATSQPVATDTPSGAKTEKQLVSDKSAKQHDEDAAAISKAKQAVKQPLMQEEPGNTKPAEN